MFEDIGFNADGDKDIKILDIKGLGRIAYVICADYNDTKLINIYRLFGVSMICVCAYTTSTAEMRKTSEDAARRFAVTTVLVNGCQKNDRRKKQTCTYICAPRPKLRILDKNVNANFTCGKEKKCERCQKNKVLYSNGVIKTLL